MAGQHHQEIMSKHVEPNERMLFSPHSPNSSNSSISSTSSMNHHSSSNHDHDAVSSQSPVPCNNSLKFSIESLLIRKDPSADVRQKSSTPPFDSRRHVSDNSDRVGHPFVRTQFEEMQHQQQLIHNHHHQLFLNRQQAASCLPISWQMLSKSWKP